jgi:hypothetical protein
MQAAGPSTPGLELKAGLRAQRLSTDEHLRQHATRDFGVPSPVPQQQTYITDLYKQHNSLLSLPKHFPSSEKLGWDLQTSSATALTEPLKKQGLIGKIGASAPDPKWLAGNPRSPGAPFPASPQWDNLRHRMGEQEEQESQPITELLATLPPLPSTSLTGLQEQVRVLKGGEKLCRCSSKPCHSLK